LQRYPATGNLRHITGHESDQAVDWLEACQYELDALDKLAVWRLEPLPANRKVVKCKWVFKKKADGRFRARLVAKGFTQLEGVDFAKLSPQLPALSPYDSSCVGYA